MVEINIYPLLYIKLLNNKTLLYNTLNSTQHLVIIYNVRESESLCLTPETNITL